MFSTRGRSNDFRRLKHRLYLVATDLDTGEAVEFGAAGFDDVPISTAVQASAALPQPESYGKFPIEVRTTTAPALQQMLAFERSKRAQSRKR